MGASGEPAFYRTFEELKLAIANISAIGVHCAPALVVFQIPPLTPAAYIVSGVVGLITKARVRPPILPGPNHDQPVGKASV